MDAGNRDADCKAFTMESVGYVEEAGGGCDLRISLDDIVEVGLELSKGRNLEEGEL